MATVTLHKKNFFEWRMDESDEWRLETYDDGNRMLYAVSKLIAFDDCCPIEISAIVFNGESVHYVGWRPGMEYTYLNDDGEIVWSRQFPEWDH